MKKPKIEVVEPIEKKTEDFKEVGDGLVGIIKSVSDFLVEIIPCVFDLIQKSKKIKSYFHQDEECEEDDYDDDEEE